MELDLNDLQFPERRPELGRYDVVVVAEVIEHLYTAPTIVLRYPARGRNPYEPIRENRLYAGHFHEYTVSELKQAAASAGLHVESCLLANYFRTGSRKNAVFARAERWVPRGLRDGITMVLRPANQTGLPGV